MSRYYDRAEQPMDTHAWIAKFEDADYKRVAFDEVDDVHLSTVWLGIDHRWGDGPPLIFESMVFGGTMDQDCERYSTEAQALAGHAAMLDRLREGKAG